MSAGEWKQFEDPRRPSPAGTRLRKFIDEKIGQLASPFVDTIAVPKRFWSRTQNDSFIGGRVVNYLGDSERVVCVRMSRPPNVNGVEWQSAPEAVFEIPKEILDEFIAEDVLEAFEKR